MKLLTLRKLHKWVALIVGLQLLLWTVSGLMFAWLDHHAVSGEHLAHPQAPVTLPDAAVVEPQQFLAEYADREISEVRLQTVGTDLVYRIEHDGGVELRRASDGAVLPIDESTARALATAYYTGDGQLTTLVRHAEPTLETRKFGPSWQASFDDAAGTSVYVDARDGALLTARSDTWRVFDFFWMLHTMDYTGRDDFNNPLVILAGTAALWIALTGLLLIFRVFRRTDFGL